MNLIANLWYNSEIILLLLEFLLLLNYKRHLLLSFGSGLILFFLNLVSVRLFQARKCDSRGFLQLLNILLHANIQTLEQQVSHDKAQRVLLSHLE